MPHLVGKKKHCIAFRKDVIKSETNKILNERK